MNQDRFAKDWLFLFSVTLIFAGGFFLTVFFYVFSSVGQENFIYMQQTYYNSLLYVAGFCTLILAPVAVLLRLNQAKSAPLPWQKKLTVSFYGFLLMQLIFYVLYLANKYGSPLKWLDLIAAVLMIYLIYSFQHNLTRYGYPAWKHITTPLNIAAGIAKAGICALILIFDVEAISTIILILLVFEMAVIISRFRFLNRYSLESHQTSRLLLMRYSILFGARIIVGLFIPLVYVIYTYIGQIESFQFIAIFLIFGELIERFLFVYSAVPQVVERE